MTAPSSTRPCLSLRVFPFYLQESKQCFECTMHLHVLLSCSLTCLLQTGRFVGLTCHGVVNMQTFTEKSQVRTLCSVIGVASDSHTGQRTVIIGQETFLENTLCKTFFVVLRIVLPIVCESIFQIGNENVCFQTGVLNQPVHRRTEEYSNLLGNFCISGKFKKL